MLRKAHAASLLQWRGHQIPPADELWPMSYLPADLQDCLLEAEDQRGF